ncbi:uncharacterized protein LOC129618226 [Condylostylus longicornis]|uniref:uncharacterized protein LOC129618226 n=1 Tax=Condylostylus longicornis TaxID=2530218 RepID=UPI00244DB4EF|nr:uncharacterized protein LOC129618226 [Condylostylus longicornis]
MGDRKRRKILSESRNEASPYEFRDGQRFVKPYDHLFETFVKRRWLGQELLMVMKNEFKAFNGDYYQRAIERGSIRINGETVPSDFILKNNQRIEHRATISEPPVLEFPIRILMGSHTHLESMSIIAVEKPVGIPCHPGAAYRLNSLIEIVKHKSRIICDECEGMDLEKVSALNGALLEDLRHGRRLLPKAPPSSNVEVLPPSNCCCLASIDSGSLRPLHRLDRLTSGIVVLGISSEAGKTFELAFREGRVSKTYVARVVGDCRLALSGHVEQTEGTSKALKRVLRGEVYCVDQKSAIYRFDEENTKKGKDVETELEFVCYDGAADESLVILRPKTGRTHQLRTQLLYLGHPIVNDPCYGPSVPRYLDWFRRVPHVQLDSRDPSNEDFHASGIFLHAWKYSMENRFSFETQLPSWCATDLS